ncbi:hypothetical protein GPECTOR_37g240 [Gonium pectorale]|uniref:Proteasome component Ecm29 N-terminal domain-containing protein n=1 Tax=Gonium pectorale TaxID=33097 RepID=A0A150GBM0_GONPE|nr:hypothetical protein GPECTOR_37g240 [Gonium pectorale]|eukprot:KXZ47234.1 hypothetical protein GPECTOR_37g240 [Gonium pectorale]
MASAAGASAAEEVAGLDRVLTRLALTDDDKLQPVLTRLIPAVLDQLKSPHDAVRKKVLEILAHVNKRLKGLPALQLPLAELVAMFAGEPPPGTSAAAYGMVRNFALVYTEMAAERAPGPERVAALPSLLRGLSRRPAAHAAILLRVAAAALEHVPQPPVGGYGAGGAPGAIPGLPLPAGAAAAAAAGGPSGPEAAPEAATAAAGPVVPPALAERYPYLLDPADREAFLSYGLKLLLYSPRPAPRPSTNLPQQHQAQQAQAQAQAAPAAPAKPPPGLSPADVKQLEEKGAPSGEQSSRRKLGLLHLLGGAGVGGPLLPAGAVLPHLLAAAVDPSDPVARRAEELLKRSAALDPGRPAADLESPALVGALLRLFHGGGIQDWNRGPEQPGAAAAAGGGSDPDKEPAPASPALRSRIVAVLCRSVTFANTFPGSLLTIQECVMPAGSTGGGGGSSGGVYGRLRQQGLELCGWVFKHAARSQLYVMGPVVLKGLLQTLDDTAASAASDSGVMTLRGFAYQDAVRLAAVQWACRLFPFQHVPARWVCVLAAGDARHDVREEAARGLAPPQPQPAAKQGTTAAAAAAAATGDAPTGAAAPAGRLPSLYGLLYYVRQRLPRLRNPVDPLAPLPLPPKSYLALIGLLRACRHSGSGALAPASAPASGTAAAAGGAGAEAMEVDTEVGAGAGAVLKADDDEYDDEAISDLGADSDPDLRRRDGGSLLAAYANALEAGLCRVEELLSSLAAYLRPLYGAKRVAQEGGPGGGGGSVKSEEAEGVMLAAGLLLARTAGRLPAGSAAAAAAAAATAGSLAGVLCGSADVAAAAAASSGSAEEAGGAESSASTSTSTTAPVSSIATPYIRATAALALSYACAAGPHAALLLPAPAPITASAAAAAGPAGGAAKMDVETPGSASRHILDLAVDRILDLLSDKDPKVASRAAAAAGFLAGGWGGAWEWPSPAPSLAEVQAGEAAAAAAVTATASSAGGRLLSGLLATANNKSEDVQFAVGEALAWAFGGLPLSAAAALGSNFSGLAEHVAAAERERERDALTAPAGAGAVPAEDAVADTTAAASGSDLAALRSRLLGRLLDELVVSPRAEVRCAGAVWLVSLLRFCGSAAELRGPALPRIQEALSGLLGDPNELTQVREQLVANLVAELQGSGAGGGGARPVKLTADTQVFEEGALGSAPGGGAGGSGGAGTAAGGSGGGGGLSTYKELCSLATDLGQPDLIYKFMDLAHHAAALNSKRGAAFGFAGIAQLAGRGGPAGGGLLAKHLAALVPKLYRYTHDPNPRVAEAMTAIWRALVDDPRSTLDA